MKKYKSLTISLILVIIFTVNVFGATVDNPNLNQPTDANTPNTTAPANNAPNQVTGKNNSNTSTDTANFKLHTGYYDQHYHFTKYLNMKVGDKTKIYIYVPENLFEGAKVTSITNNFPQVVTYSGDGTVEALRSIGYGREIKIHTTVYIPKEDKYEYFTTKIHTYN